MTAAAGRRWASSSSEGASQENDRRLADPGALARHREALARHASPAEEAIAVCVRHRLPGERRAWRSSRPFAPRSRRAAPTPRSRLRATGCHGFCERGPLVVLYPEGILYKQVSAKDVAEIVEKTVLGGEVIERLLYKDPATQAAVPHGGDIPFYANQHRVALRNNGHIDPTDIDDYIALGGYAALAKALRDGPEEVLDEVKRSGLRGRGGAGFPTGPQVGGLPQAPQGERKYVLCNGDEGDPGRVHGPLDHGGQPAQRDRGDDHRRLRDRRPRGLRLRARRVPARGGAPDARHRAGAASSACSARTSSAPASPSTSRSAAAAAPSSAASRAP